MRVVFVTHIVTGASGGGAERARGIHAGLTELGHHVTTVVLPVRKTLFSHRSRPWWYFAPAREWRRELSAAAADADVLLATYLPVAYACAVTWRELKARPGSRPLLIYDAENDEPELARQFKGQHVTNTITDMEREVVSLADVTWTPGARDMRTMRARHPGVTLVDLPNGVGDLPDSSGIPRRQCVAFTYGSWTYGPNIEGLRLLAKTDYDGAGELHVFGSMANATRRELAADASRHQASLQWHFRGFEPSLLAVASCPGTAVVALWQGAGTKLRTVQLAAMGVPAVVTPEALSGLPDWFAKESTVRESTHGLLSAALAGGVASEMTLRDRRARTLAELGWRTLVANALTQSLPTGQWPA